MQCGFLDQYQISTDARSGITSDPKREDEPEYIVRLVGELAGSVGEEECMDGEI